MYLGRSGSHGRLEVKLQRLAQIGQCFIDRLALTSYINTHRLGDMPAIFLPDTREECLFSSFRGHYTLKFVQAVLRI